MSLDPRARSCLISAHVRARANECALSSPTHLNQVCVENRYCIDKQYGLHILDSVCTTDASDVRRQTPSGREKRTSVVVVPSFRNVNRPINRLIEPKRRRTPTIHPSVHPTNQPCTSTWFDTRSLRITRWRNRVYTTQGGVPIQDSRREVRRRRRRCGRGLSWRERRRRRGAWRFGARPCEGVC